MSSYAEPNLPAVGLRALLAAVTAYRSAHRSAHRPDRGGTDTPGGPTAGTLSTGAGASGVSGGTARDTGIDGVPVDGAPVDGAPADGVAVGGLGGGVGPTGGAPQGAARPDAAEAEPGGEPWALVRAAQAGDPEAFGRLYDRYVDLVFRYVYHRVADRALAEDLTSETFLRALRRIGSLTYQGRDAGAWFVTIARNLVLDHVKSGRNRFELTTGDLRDADQTTEGPEAAVLDRLTSASLLRCVRQLGAEQQECIVLRFLHGLSVADTAAIMGKNDGAIKALQHRAIRRLATLLPEDPR